MVNEVQIATDEGRGAQEAEHTLALSYASQSRRAGLQALLDLDHALGSILRTTREPLVGQMRLAWWRDAILALDTMTVPAEPVLTALSSEVLPQDISGQRLAAVVDGWEALLQVPLVTGSLVEHAAQRGGLLFACAARLLGGDDQRASVAGQGWALADLSANLSDAALADRARVMAAERLDEALRPRWPRELRALGALAWLARMDLVGRRPPGHPARVWRLLRFRLTGR